MKKITLLKSLLVVMALSLFSFSAVAEEVTFTYTPSEHLGSATTNLTTNEYVMNADLVFTADKGGTTNNVGYNKDGDLRLYANKSDGNGCSLTLKPKNGVTITKIVLNATGTSYTPTVKYSVDGGDEIEGSWSSTAMTISGISAKTSFKFRNASIGDTKQLRLKNIVVTYTTSSEGGGSGNEGGEEPTPDPEEPVVPEGPQTVTIAEFLTKSVSADVYYELTGVISNITNTSYGNFDLTDATGSVLVYGLKENETAGKQTFANLGLVAGDTLTLRGVRAEYNSKAQVGNAYYVSHKDYVAPEGGEEPTPELPEGATQETVDLSTGYENAETLSTVDVTNAILTFAKNNGGTSPAWYASGTAARLYGSNSLTIAAKSGFKLYQVKFGFVTGKDMPDANNSEVTNGTYDYSTHTWTATENSGVAEMSITNKNGTGHFRLQNIVITYVPSAEVIFAPTASVPSGEKYEAFDVELTCATEGAEVYYTLNGGAETKYTAAINIAATTELKTWSVKGSDKSDNLVVNYTFPTSVADIAALIADASGKNVRISGAVTVLAQTGKYLWVKDASASMLVYGTAPAEYNNGDQLIGLVGKVSTYSGAKQIVPAYFPAAVAGTTVEPTIVALTDVTANTVHQYIRLENVTYTNATTLTAGENTLAMYNRFGYTYEGAEGDNVNVVAIAGLYNTTVQVYPISIEKVTTSTEPTILENSLVSNIFVQNGTIVAEGEIQIFSITGQNVTDMNGNLQKGVYVVKSANSACKVVVR